MTDEERKEIDDLKEQVNDLKERVIYLEHSCREHTKLISKMSDTMYVMAKAIKEDKK